MQDSFATQGILMLGGARHPVRDLAALAKAFPRTRQLPYSLKILLENLLRHEDGRVVRRADIEALLRWDPAAEPATEIAFHPARVLLQDFTGVPAVVDLAAMRDAMRRMGGDPQRINPLQPVDLVIDHSVQVDHFGNPAAFGRNAELELARNQERYRFLRWGQSAFDNFRVVPPDTGIVHQINLEYLAQVVFTGEGGMLYPDTLVGTDSHTTMVNGLGVLGWGVGGIEAEAAMLGQPLSMLIPQVVGFRLEGVLATGATATDLVLVITEMLRQASVVGKFVEFVGPGVASLSLADRATIANMAPEYGATMGFFPVDKETLAYLRFSNRADAQVSRVEAYCKRQGLFLAPDSPDPLYTQTLSLRLDEITPSIAGPKRPQDRIPLVEAKPRVTAAMRQQYGTEPGPGFPVSDGDKRYELHHGDVVIAAITSCTNTSNPSVMLAAGLLAQRAVARGLSVKPWVKTSLAPGSKVVTEYLRAAGLLPALEALGFHLVGYGCTTCIGNSGPLPPAIAEVVKEQRVVVAAVLSGNRNFEGRINPQTRMNFLASPPLVVAYALAGTTLIDFERDPLATDTSGQPVFLRDLWPMPQVIHATVADAVKKEQFASQYAEVFTGDERWRALTVPSGGFYAWDDGSTYIRRPPFFEDVPATPKPVTDITGARVLALLGDSVTTDHISPAGSIPTDSPAGRYLVERGVAPADFNSYGARRGNHEVMLRGTLANIRIRNLLLPGTEGGLTRHLPSGETLSIYDAAMRYQGEGTPLVILAGAEYGTGSSRDWAAKGTALLGVRAVLAKSFERIHRSNLVGMGVLPLQLDAGQDAASLGLSGEETFTITGIAAGLAPKKRLTVEARGQDGRVRTFSVTARVDTPNEVDYYLHGGILLYVLRQLRSR
jgi:aconitate hydratase